MTQEVKLSVVIPVYNGSHYIRETIDSILSSSKGYPVECIVVDDGSTDSTPEIVQLYGQAIRVFRQQNSGEGAAVNKGIFEAKGEYVVVVSADDPILTSNLFAGVTDFFEQHADVVAWYPDWIVIDSTGQTLKKIHLPPYDFEDLFSRNKVLPGPGTWFRRKNALAINGRNVLWKYVGDYDFWLRLSRQGLFVHRNEVLAQWRNHPNSTSIAERGVRMAQERIQVIEDFVSANSESLTYNSISLARAHAHYLAARLGFFSREVNARRLFFQAIQINPKVIHSVMPQEIIFLAFFPLSKRIYDLLKRLRG